MFYVTNVSHCSAYACHLSKLTLLQPYSLEPYKSKTDKLNLLDEAIRYHDGNAITAVSVMFQKNMYAVNKCENVAIKFQEYNTAVCFIKSVFISFMSRCIHFPLILFLLQTVLFLQNSVKKSIFTNAMIQRPVAVEHYISYLRHHYDYQELVDFLG